MDKNQPEKISYWKNVFILQKYVWKFAPELFFIQTVKICCQITMNVLVYEMMMKRVLDAITQNQDWEKVVLYVLWVGIWQISFYFINNVYTNYIYKTVQLKMHKGVHNIIFEKVQKVDLEKYDNHEFYNDYIWALDRADIELLNSCNNIFELLFDCGHAIALFCITLVYDKFLLMFVAVPMVLHVLLGNYSGKIEYEYERKNTILQRHREYSRRIFYQRDFAKELKLYPIGNILCRNFSQNVEKQMDVCKKYGFRLVWTGLAGDSLSSVFNYMLLYIYLAFRAIVQSAYTAGTCAALINAVGNLSYALERVFKRIPQIRKNGMFAEKIVEFLNYKGTVESFTSDKSPDTFEMLEFRNVSFRYPNSENDSIHQINLSLKRGEKLAIVGVNGAGNTTLVKLLMRYYDVTNGKIFYNGTDIRKFTTADYRAQYSTIFQDFQIYAISVEENISRGKASSDKMQILAALKNSGLEILSDKLSANLTKEFDEKGLILSGGQYQKLAIARALYRNSDIVIMDEASSALDPISEAEINNTIMKQMKDKSMIIITHRLSTIKHADKICFMEKGCILEQGSHEELMKVNGKYAQMYRIQAEQYISTPKNV